jgi:hypothetical protein
LRDPATARPNPECRPSLYHIRFFAKRRLFLDFKGTLDAEPQALSQQDSDLPTVVKIPGEAYAQRHIVFIIDSIYLLLYAAYAVTANPGMLWLIPFLSSDAWPANLQDHDHHA